MGNNLYVGNLDFQTSSQELADLFEGAGAVRRAQVITGGERRESKGFAFVEMGSEDEANRAISMFNGYILRERTLVVNEARPREQGGGRPNVGQAARPTRFREVKHKVRGGRKARRF